MPRLILRLHQNPDNRSTFKHEDQENVMILVFSTFAAPNTTGYETCIVKCRIENPKEEWRQEDNEPKKKRLGAKRGKERITIVTLLYVNVLMKKRGQKKQKQMKERNPSISFMQKKNHIIHASMHSFHKKNPPPSWKEETSKAWSPNPQIH
jgi:hypothetical protein